jgi:uncharacterized membrane protein
MSGQSSVGNSQVYEAGDQRVPPDSQKAENQATPYKEGEKNSHQANDSSMYYTLSAQYPSITPERAVFSSTYDHPRVLHA